MRFESTQLDGVFVIDIDPRRDERGYFTRTWCRREFEDHGLNSHVVQINEAHSPRAGTLRGLHYQEPPFAEVKIVRCLAGYLWDVIVDLRPESPTCGQWLGIELTAESGRMLYVPEGFAHGYQTLTAETRMTYQTTQFYTPSAARGVRYDDPRLAIEWPLAVTAISDQDRQWPEWQPTAVCLPPRRTLA